MTPQEIKELQEMQSKIDYFASIIGKARNGIAIYVNGSQVYNTPNGCPKALFPNMKELIISMYENELAELIRQRNTLIICTSQTKTSYKPIDILDKE